MPSTVESIDWPPYFAFDTRSVIDGEPLFRASHESLTLAFFLANRRCMILGPFFSQLVKVDAGAPGQTRYWLQESSCSTALPAIWGSCFDRKFVRTRTDGGLVSAELILWPRKHLG